MSKKNSKAIVRAEVLPPMQSAPVDVRKMIDELVSQRVAEIMADEKSAILEPFMQGKRVSIAIRKQQDVVQLKKWRYYWDKWACLICGKKDAGHWNLGMCAKCFGLVSQRMKAILDQAYAERPTFSQPRDLAEVAQEALAPSIKVLKLESGGKSNDQREQLS